MSIYKDYIANIESNCGNYATLGYSNLGLSIPYIANYRKANVLMVGGVHAREHITADLLIALLPAIKNLPIDCVPMLNPDGIVLAKGGASELPLAKADRERLTKINGGSCDFSQWKANARAVDINVNFDADWGMGEGNLKVPAPASYIGRYPESEPETKAVADLIRRKNYSLVIAYHSKGEEVYFGYGGNFSFRKEAESVANCLGYKLKTTPNSTGGLKDYFVKHTGRLGLTVEVGRDCLPHPYPMAELPSLVSLHKKSIPLIVELGEKLWTMYKNL